MAQERVDVVIVGAGFSGIGALYHLLRQGQRVVVLEAGDGVGGTWYHNRYPGARCDIESLDYSYGFSDPLQQDWAWSERYAGQPEILRYLNHVVDRFALRPHIRLGTKVSAARYDGGRWTVRTADGAEFDAKYTVLATGVLSAAQVPRFPGLASFRGRWYHTADWPAGGVDFTGQRVGVIGTGSSATQLIPIVAARAGELTVFQRTPNFVMPAQNHPMDRAVERAWKAEYPQRREFARASRFGHNQLSNPVRGADLTAAEREAEFERRWQLGGLYMMRAFADILTDRAVNEHAAEFVRGKIRAMVHDPQTAETLCPQGLPLGTKRLCSGTGYYETFNAGHVHLVDVRSAPIEEITPDGLRTTDREYRLDALILATGFDAMTGSMRRIDIRGRDGAALAEHWHAGPRTYLGVASSGFPNLFIMAGPQSPSVFSNMVNSAEQHAEWIRDCIGYLEEHGVTAIEADQDAEQHWVEHVTATAARTLYQESRSSWFWGANVPGKPRVFMPYLGGVNSYGDRLAAVARDGYRGFTLRFAGRQAG